MSAFKEAFARAGYKPADERLWNAAVIAWTAAEGNLERGRDELFKIIEHDAELVLELFKPWHRVAAQKLLEEVSQEAREEERRRQAALRSPNTDGRQRPVAVPSGSGHSWVDNHRIGARPAPHPAPRHIHEIIRNKSNTVRQSLLDTFRIELPAAYGRMSIPIGDCTPKEAMSWVGATERDIKFVRLLTQNLPPDEKIRKHSKDLDIIDSLYAQAMRSEHAA
jgi:hypothetical protein